MKLNILRLSIAVLSLAGATIVFTSARAEKFEGLQANGTVAAALPSQTPAATQEKTVEQVQKNIKVLSGLPQSQLIPVMNYIAASLGRRCNFCHVNKNGQWDYAADDKPEKSTAREMIKLVFDINKTTERLKLDPVSCYTCHRGRQSPQSLPPLPLPQPSPAPGNPTAGAGGGAAGGAQPQASPSPRPTLPSADDLIARYITAIGGQPAIDKIKTRIMTGNVSTANGNTGTYEIIQSAPDRSYESFVTQRGSMERVVTAKAGWEKTAQGLRELTGQQLADLQRSAQLSRNLKLKEQYSRLRVIGKEKIDDRDTYVVIGTTTDNRRERLSFDVENGLLLRRVTYMETIIGVIPEQTDFEDYRDVDGVKMPFTVRISLVDAGNPYITRKLTEIKLNAPVDDSKFNMPAATKPTAPPELSAVTESEMQKHVGETVTLRGRFSLRGKTGPFILVGGRPVYLEASGSFSWEDRYSKMEGREVTVTGTLRFARASEATNAREPAAGVTAHFYFEAETARVELSPA